MSARVQPGIAAAHPFDVQKPLVEVELKKVDDLQFAARSEGFTRAALSGAVPSRK